MSATVRISSRRSISGVCTGATKSRTVLGSETSRFCAVSLITRWFFTSQDTAAVSPAISPSRGHRLFGNRRTDFGVIAGQALGHVVQQNGDIQHLARLDALDDVAESGCSSRSSPRSIDATIADGADQMLVHRVVVIHVELHQPHDMAEFRHEAAQHARFVHQPQRAFGIVARRQDLQEQPIGFRIVAQRRR